MTVAPIVKTVTVKATPAKAFDLFTTKISQWWKAGETLGKSPHQAIIIEPRVGGRWMERDADGKEIQWGKVLAWEPARRLLLAWQINTQFKYDPELITELEISFVPAKAGGTVMTLEHRNLERFGAGAEKFIAMLDASWLRNVTTVAKFIEKEKDR